MRSQEPFNAEPPLDALSRSFVTPTGSFFVRSHGDVPVIDGQDWHLTVSGTGITPLRLSLAELRERFPRRSVVATIQCAGNRRAELSTVSPTLGLQWDAGAIGTAEWTGASLGDVLRAAGLGEADGLHVAFTCHDVLDHKGERVAFGVSIPARKALSPEVLLAYEMNGAELAPEHGFPVRAVVPGYAGVRSPKWLRSIEVRARPSDNPMQQLDYKLFPREIREDTADWSRGAAIDELPLNAAICDPAPGAVVPAGRVRARGYAVASGRAIARVELSCDGGRTWIEADLAARPDTPWAWTPWSADLDLRAGQHELAVRAWDSAGQTQPAEAAEVWNFKGYCCAAWHRVRVQAR
ncbi:MAG: molybdopterin oxidoreductase [Enterovirga sp.]|nr:molybdopterin oxidoreductase [Enterovirga sp.]